MGASSVDPLGSSPAVESGAPHSSFALPSSLCHLRARSSKDSTRTSQNRELQKIARVPFWKLVQSQQSKYDRLRPVFSLLSRRYFVVQDVPVTLYFAKNFGVIHGLPTLPCRFLAVFLSILVICRMEACLAFQFNQAPSPSSFGTFLRALELPNAQRTRLAWCRWIRNHRCPVKVIICASGATAMCQPSGSGAIPLSSCSSRGRCFASVAGER